MYEKLKSELKQIVEIVESVPEKYQDKCFDLLLSNLLNTSAPTKKEHIDRSEKKDPLKINTAISNSSFTLPAKIRTFIQRYSITEDQLRSLIMVEGEEVHFIYEPKEVKNATGQIQWALLLGLKSALLSRDMIVDPEDVRSICIEKGFYDKANFAATFKTPSNKRLFNGGLKPQGEPVKLSTQGEEKLAELLKDLSKKGV